MAYADFTFYKDNYYGAVVSAEEWPRVAERASEYIDYITSGRAANNAVLPEVKKACCAVADVCAELEAAKAASAGNGALASQSVGSWSASYRSGEELDKQYKPRLYAAACRHLLTTGLLNRSGG